MRETIDMARKVYGAHTEWTDSLIERLKQFEALVRADEREACAKVCEEQYEYYGHDHVFAKAIRARGQA